MYNNLISIYLKSSRTVPLCFEQLVELILLILFISWATKWLFGASIFSGFFKGIGYFFNQVIYSIWKVFANFIAILFEKILTLLKIILEYSMNGVGYVLEILFEKLADIFYWLWEKILDGFTYLLDKLLDLFAWLRSFF